jgi:hypothetical protein
MKKEKNVLKYSDFIEQLAKVVEEAKLLLPGSGRLCVRGRAVFPRRNN